MPSHKTFSYINAWLRERMPDRDAYHFIGQPEFERTVEAFASGKTIKLIVTHLPDGKVRVDCWRGI